MIPESLSPVANHLWQSTLFAGAAGLLTLALRNNPARVRHAIWVVASLKFLVPFSLLIALGSQVEWQTQALTPPAGLSVVLDQVSQPFTPPAPSMLPVSTAPEYAGTLPVALWTVWACGFVLLAALWWVRWRRIAAAVRSGSALQMGLPIPVISSPAFIEPGVFGVFRPVMVVPGDLFA